MSEPGPRVFRSVVDQLAVAVYVFDRTRLVYANAAAYCLAARLRTNYRIELEVILRAHLTSALEESSGGAEELSGGVAAPAVTLLTASHGEPFYVHLIPVARKRRRVAITVCWLGAEIEAFRLRHGLSRRGGGRGTRAPRLPKPRHRHDPWHLSPRPSRST